MARRHQADPGAPHVVICGAGFGGLSAVGRLTRAGMRVTLVDDHLYSTFQPLLYQVATAGLNPGDVAYPAGGFVRRSAVVQLAGRLRWLRMRGTLAWLAWFALHLVYLLGGRNRVSTLVNLTFRYVAWGHGGAVIVGDDPGDSARLPGPRAEVGRDRHALKP